MKEEIRDSWPQQVKDFRDRTFRSESQLEEYFVEQVRKVGGLAIKFNSSGANGLPDRIIFYNGAAWLVELKTPKGTTQPNQKVMHTKLLRYGFEVRIVRDKSQVHNFIEDMINYSIEI